MNDKKGIDKFEIWGHPDAKLEHKHSLFFLFLGYYNIMQFLSGKVKSFWKVYTCKMISKNENEYNECTVYE